MFSSLEALDAQDALEAIPVTRQGAFQPKAKPRARKASGATGTSVSTSSKRSTEEPSSDLALKVNGGLARTYGAQLDVLLPLSTRADSALPVGVYHSNDVADTSVAHCTDIASAAEEQVPKERAVRNDDEAEVIAQRRLFCEPPQQTTPVLSTVPTLISCNRLGSPSEAPNNLKTVDLEMLVMSSILGSNDAENDDFVNQQNEHGVISQQQENAGPKIAAVQETVLETEHLETEKMADDVVAPKRKSSRAKIAALKENVLETVVDNSTQSCLQVDTQQLNSNTFMPVVPVKGKRTRRQCRVRQENVGLPKNTNEKAAMEPSKPRKERFSAFAAVTSVTSQPDAEHALSGDGVSETAACVEEGQDKKRLKKSTLRKKKVEKRALNPADPNLDPKKLTMKDIIRLAEAKERMSKEGTSRKLKDSSEKASSNGEAEQEQQEERMSFAPQVQVIDGRIVINKESLTVSAHPVNDIRHYTRVEETHSKLNYHSYMKRTPKKVWTKEDTELFYKALQEFGTNFALMQHLFPGRTRRQIFLKFKKEERAYPSRLAEAMTQKSSEYSQFMEVINRLNLLPDEARDNFGDEHPPVSCETTSVREEHEASMPAFMEDGLSIKSKKPDADRLGLKMEESFCDGVNLQKNMNDWEEKMHDANKVGSDFESVRSFILTGDSDNPKKSPSPPRKFLFSYQNLSSKPSKSLFSYQQK